MTSFGFHGLGCRVSGDFAGILWLVGLVFRVLGGLALAG